MNFNKLISLTCIALTLGACAFEGRQPAPTYILDSRAVSHAEKPAAYHIKILTPEVSSGLSTRQIVVIDETARLNYIADGEWPEPLPVMLQNVWLDSIRQSGLVASVSSDQSSVRADRLLQISAQEFNFIRKDDAVTARVRYDVKVLEPTSRKILAVRQSEASEPVPPGQFAGAMASLNKANSEAMARLITLLADDLGNPAR